MGLRLRVKGSGVQRLGIKDLKAEALPGSLTAARSWAWQRFRVWV